MIQGLLSLELKSDHVYLHLIENAPFNRGAMKIYEGVAGNLFAFACKLSFECGFEGNISFNAKTKLIDHYRKMLGAKHAGGTLMLIDSEAATFLLNSYFGKKLKKRKFYLILRLSGALLSQLMRILQASRN